MSTLASKKRLPSKRRRHSIEFKRRLVKACDASDQSVARIAQQHGVNPNLLHKWRKQLGQFPVDTRLNNDKPDFIRLPQTMNSLSHLQTIRVEFPGAVVVHWPLDRLDELAGWLKEVAQ